MDKLSSGWIVGVLHPFLRLQSTLNMWSVKWRPNPRLLSSGCAFSLDAFTTFKSRCWKQACLGCFAEKLLPVLLDGIFWIETFILNNDLSVNMPKTVSQPFLPEVNARYAHNKNWTIVLLRQSIRLDSLSLNDNITLQHGAIFTHGGWKGYWITYVCAIFSRQSAVIRKYCYKPLTTSSVCHAHKMGTHQLCIFSLALRRLNCILHLLLRTLNSANLYESRWSIKSMKETHTEVFRGGCSGCHPRCCTKTRTHQRRSSLAQLVNRT